MLFNCAGRNSITDIFFLLFAWRKGRSTSVIRVQIVCTLYKEISLKRLISNACDPAGARTQDLLEIIELSRGLSFSGS